MTNKELIRAAFDQVKGNSELEPGTIVANIDVKLTHTLVRYEDDGQTSVVESIDGDIVRWNTSDTADINAVKRLAIQMTVEKQVRSVVQDVATQSPTGAA